VGGGHPFAVSINEEPGQQAPGLPIGATVSAGGITAKLLLYGAPDLLVDDGLVLPFEALALVDDVPDIDWVGQQLVDMPSREGLTAAPLAIIGALSR